MKNTTVYFFAYFLFIFLINTGLPDYRTTGLPDYRTTGLPDYRTTGLPDYRTTGLPDYRTVIRIRNISAYR
ncbi:hypothetical protein FEK76_25585 [Salmonella enterica]|nr:hypothetical protein [Salmonella enterica]